MQTKRKKSWQNRSHADLSDPSVNIVHGIQLVRALAVSMAWASWPSTALMLFANGLSGLEPLNKTRNHEQD